MKLSKVYLLIMSLALLLLFPLSAFAKTFMGTVNMQVGETTQISAEPSTYYTVTGSWSKTGDAIIISSVSNRSCHITAIKPGTATLEWMGVINTTWEEMYWTIIVTSAPILVTEIKLNKSNLDLSVNEEEYLYETVYPSNATNKSVVWSSSNDDVATVNNSGLVKGCRIGSAIVTCKAIDGSGVTATCTVNVAEKISTTISTVSAGYLHSLMLDKNGSLWGCGYNYSGQLGDGSEQDRLSPIRIVDNVASVVAGWSHTLIVKKDASLWGCGSNRYGQLGETTSYVVHTPVKIMDNIASVAAGDDFSLIVKKDGTLWACGLNHCGQLGDNSNTNRNKPVKIMDGVASVAAGQRHSIILKTDGSLWTCGRNFNGQLGDGTNEDKNYPVKVAEKVFSVAAGSDHTMIIKTDGSLWTCGANGNGQLGFKRNLFDINYGKSSFTKIMDDVAFVGTSKSSVTQIIKNDGSYWACGYNGDDNLGGGPTSGEISTPFKVMDGVSTISSGLSYTLLVKKDGSLWVCGLNNKGQLGDGTTTDRHSLVKIVEGVFIHITKITLNNTSLTLKTGQEETLKATIKPDNATDKTVTWSSSNTNIVTVNSTGKVVAKSSGNATVTCKANDGSGVYATCTIKVESPTGIRDVQMEDKDVVPVHSLSGLRLAKPLKGVSIINGRKVVVK